MKQVNIYQSITAERSNELTKHIQFVDPFHIRRSKHPSGRIIATNKRSASYWGENTLELKVDDETYNLIKPLKNETIMLIRYMPTWKDPDRFFLKKIRSIPIHFQDNIVIFKELNQDIIFEYDLCLTRGDLIREIRKQRLIRILNNETTT